MMTCIFSIIFCVSVMQVFLHFSLSVLLKLLAHVKQILNCELLLVQHIEDPASLGKGNHYLFLMDLVSLKIYLKPHNRWIFEKNTPMADSGPSCSPLGQNGDQKGQSAAVPFTIAMRD